MNSNVPADLKKFSPVVMWQDQRNSNVPYTAGGNIDTTNCTGGTLDNPCYGILDNNPRVYPASNGIEYYDGTVTAWGSRRELEIWASSHFKMYGAVYQPRGAWAVIHSGSAESGPIQLVSGAYFMGGGPDVTLRGLPNPVTSLGVVLVE